jgi:hypothetical protein
LFEILTIDLSIEAVLKLISIPSFEFISLRQVNNCLRCTSDVVRNLVFSFYKLINHICANEHFFILKRLSAAKRINLNNRGRSLWHEHTGNHSPERAEYQPSSTPIGADDYSGLLTTGFTRGY